MEKELKSCMGVILRADLTGQCTEVRFASFLSGGSTTYYGNSNKFTGKETGKTHFCAAT